MEWLGLKMIDWIIVVLRVEGWPLSRMWELDGWTASGIDNWGILCKLVL